jgi:hypothetical protein
MTKFNTTNSNLFNNKNKEFVPDWMEKIADIEIKEKNSLDIDFEKRGSFADQTQVYRTELNAEPRYLDKYNQNKIMVDAKVSLAKFLTGKKYKVVNSDVNSNNVSLSVEINNVSANFNFPFEVEGNKLKKCATFYINDSEYPFSSAGLRDSIEDIKNGTLKKATITRNMDNGYVINREEIIRRYNGSLRKATDKINELLKDGTIVGVGSNSYGTFYSVDELFPQEEKSHSLPEKLAEFHFSPNTEHIAPNEYKSSDYLKIEASKVIKKYFDKFSLGKSHRDDNKLQIKAQIMNNKGITQDVVFDFDIDNEKLVGEPSVHYNNKYMTVEGMLEKINETQNEVLNRFANNYIFDAKIGGKYILTKKEIENKLFKVAQVTNIDGLVNEWISRGLVQPINSETVATNKTFSELVNLSKLSSISDYELEEINLYERKFGQDILLDTDSDKLNEHYADLTEVEASREQKIFNINNYISKRIKNYKIASISSKGTNKYKISIDLLNKSTGTRHTIPLEVNLENSKIISCYANIGSNKVELEELLENFAKNKILSLYLQNKKENLNAGPILITEKGIKNKLSKVITASKVQDVLNDWISSGKMTRLDEEHLASDHSFQELLATVDDGNMISIGEMEERGYQERYFGKKIKVKTDERTNDTGSREVDDVWSEERKVVACSDKISKIFKEYDVLFVDEDDDKFFVSAKVKNPSNGIKLKLRFSFNNAEGKVGDMISVSDYSETVSVDKIANLLEKHTSDASNQYRQYNKVNDRSYNVIIGKNNLQDKLKVVATKSNISSIVDYFVDKGYLKPIDSRSYASTFTIGELVSVASDKFNIKQAIEEMKLSKKEEHQIQLPEKYELNNDTRELKETTREIDQKLASVKEKLVTYTYKAAKDKKITMSKCGQFLHNLENAKTVQDLEKVSKELKNYYK